MSDEIDEVQLTPDEQRAVSEVLRWEDEALIRLGSAQLRYTEAAAALRKAETHLDRAANVARQAEEQRKNVMRVISENLALPPGAWHFDANTGKLIKKEGPDA